MIESYRTVSKRGDAEIIEKRSRFIAAAEPAETPEAAACFVTGISKKYHDASHHVYAYIIGKNSEFIKFSDDGEPSGTAAAPILSVIKGQNLVDTVVVVTRYFGGTLLGAGGLVRAYGQAAKLAVDAALPVVRVLYQTYALIINYTLLNIFQYELPKRGFIISEAAYAGSVTLTVLTEQPREAEFLELAADLSGGTAETVYLGSSYK